MLRRHRPDPAEHPVLDMPGLWGTPRQAAASQARGRLHAPRRCDNLCLELGARAQCGLANALSGPLGDFSSEAAVLWVAFCAAAEERADLLRQSKSLLHDVGVLNDGGVLGDDGVPGDGGDPRLAANQQALVEVLAAMTGAVERLEELGVEQGELRAFGADQEERLCAQGALDGSELLDTPATDAVNALLP
jgi:hypothetical protein